MTLTQHASKKDSQMDTELQTVISSIHETNQAIDAVITRLGELYPVPEPTVTEPKADKKALGQYFTIDKGLQDWIFNHVKHKGEELLEPSFGAGHLLQPFLSANPRYPMTLYELDHSVKPVVSLAAPQKVMYGDFTKVPLIRKFKTIVGNPPYVKKKKTGNLYIEFIELAFNALSHDGELLFIVPSDFLKVTRAAKIIKKMCTTGAFTDFYFPHDEGLFEGAAVDVVLFRYEKGARSATATVNGEVKSVKESNGILTFPTTIGSTLGEHFDVYVGLVTGKDEVYKQSFGNMDLLADFNKSEKYIYPFYAPIEKNAINTHLWAHETELKARRIRKFDDENWWQWGAPRNIKTMTDAAGKPCIYVRNMTRKPQVSAAGTVQYFGGTLLCAIPRRPMRAATLEFVVSYLNSAEAQRDYIYAGRFKIGHKQLCNLQLPPFPDVISHA